MDFLSIGVALILLVLASVFLFRGQSPALSKPSSGSAPAEAKKAAPAQKPLEKPAFEFKIVFASQSGTAEGFAYQLQKEAKSFNVLAHVTDIEQYDAESLEQETLPLVFLVATYGEGDPPDSGVEFQKWLLRDDHSPTTLSSLQYTVFGLGNKQYEFYNAAGIRFDSRLEELGARRVCALGLGDDDTNIEEDFSNWRRLFWDEMSQKYGVRLDSVPKQFNASFRVTYTKNPADEQEDGKADAAEVKENPVERRKFFSAFDSKYPLFELPVLACRELRAQTNDGSTMHVELDLTDSRLPYVTADNLGVHPRNDYRLVARAAKRLGVRPSDSFVLEKIEKDRRKMPVPSPCTVRDALLWFCDLTCMPRLSTLEMLAFFATDTDEKARLARMAKPEGKEEYNEFVVHDGKNIVDVLEAFPSIQVPFPVFLEYCPRLQPRYYTIASSSKVHSSSIHITVSVVRQVLPSGRVFSGVCSSFLAGLRAGRDRVVVHVRPSTFRLPRVLSTPVIMVGPGTGVAPFRAFWHEFEHLRNGGAELGKSWLFFGCRRQQEDWIYQDEMESAVAKGALTQLTIAFSRHQEQKEYVQHKVKQNGSEIWQLIDQGRAHFFVCGSTSMGKEVREFVVDIIHTHGGKSLDEAQKYLRQMQTSNRFIQELWG
eukprot:TRINITY_DN1472_c0_g1_i6.p1 TRINITY_DN1472_c0_g1~~TRINITY_DN1472_c0_g1_i6.p1  ORF type:complete len:654 (+),score=255.01 TRINITY_DN1472_c0_g1_i6:90-2051(+)